jgi:hypothetical protein
MTLDIMARAQNAPSPGARVVGNKLYHRQIPNLVGPTSIWSSVQLANMTMPSGVTSYVSKPQEDISISLSLLAAGGQLRQFELTRVAPTPGASNLPADWNLVELIVTFS